MTVTIGVAAIAGVLHITASAADAGAATAASPGRTLALATLVTWLLDAGSGGYMLRTWIVRGGLRRQRSSDRLAPRVVFTHFGMASTGLLIWLSYLATRWIVLAWLAVGMLTVVIGLGVSTVTVWTPFPAHRVPADPADPGGSGDPGAPGEPGDTGGSSPSEDALTGRLTDEMLTRALTDDVLLGRLVEDVVTQSRVHPRKPARRTRAHAATLIPAGHGMAAIATMILAVLTAATAVR